MKMYRTCLILLMSTGVVYAADKIPYPQALDKASVVQSQIDNLDKDGLVIGNGDLNALVHSSGDDILLTVSKNVAPCQSAKTSWLFCSGSGVVG